MAQSPENNPNPVLNVDCQALLEENRALKDEVQKLRARLEEPEELRRAISEGDLDALVMPVSAEDLSVFILNSADSALRTLVETANEDMVIVDADFKITYIGKRLINKAGYSQEEVIGRQWLDFVDEECKTAAKLKMETRRQGIDESYELKFICKDGSPYWALIGSKPLFDENGKFKGALAMLTDVTELKRAEEELAKQARLLNLSYDAILIRNNMDRITYWNLGAQEIYGYTKEEALGRTPHELLKTQFPQPLEEIFEVLYRDDRWTGELTHTCKDDRKITVVTRWVLDRDAQGSPNSILEANSDITERKRIEEELKQSVKQYRTLGDTISYGVWLTDATGYCTYTSPSFLEMVDMSMEQVQKFGWLHLLPPEDVQPTIDHWLRCIQTGENFEREHCFRAKDGSYRNVLAIGRPIKNGEGKITGWVGLNLDITERKQAEKRLQESEARFKNLFEVISNGVAIYDVIDDGHNFIFKDINPAGERIDHVQRDDIIGKSLYEFFPNIGEMGLDAAFRRVWQTGKPEFFPVTFYEDENIALWVTNWIYKLPSGELVAVFEDITESKKAEEELRQSADQFRTLIKNVNSGVALVDEDGRFTVVNPSFMQIFGLDSELDILNVNSQDWSRWEVYGEDGKLLHVDDHPVRKVAMTGKPVKDQLVELRNPGTNELKWLLVSAEPTLKEDGQLYRIICTYHDITERKQAEEAMSESEKKYRNIVETANEGIWVVGADLRTTYVNEKLEEMLGYSREEMIGKYGRDFTNNENKGILELSLDKRQQGISEIYELKFIRKDGTPIWMLVNTKSLLDDNGKFAGSLGMLTDITERKQIEAELREAYEILQTQSEELQVSNEELRVQSDELHEANTLLHDNENKFRTLAENSPDLIARFDRQNRCIYANPAIAKLYFKPPIAEFYGWSMDECIDKTNYEPIRELDIANFSEKQREDVFTTGKPEITEFQYTSPQGKKCYFNTRIVPEFIGDEVTYFLVISHDITAMKEAEAKLNETLESLEEKVKERTAELEVAYNLLKESEEGLRLSNIYNRSLIEASVDPLATIGHDGKITDVNEATELVTGYSRDELIGTDFIDYFNEPEVAKIGYQEVFRKGFVSDYALEIRHRNGSITPVLYNASVYMDESGEVIGIFAAARDITERKKAEEMLKLKMEELERSNEELQQFAYVSSHDLQEPLRMITSYL